MTVSWRVRGRRVPILRPFVFGILNATPDSFSDGGQFLSASAAIAQVRRMVDEGADGIDIGGESTRPQGAQPVSAEEEIRRVLPVVRAVREEFVALPISLDTTKGEVARAALDAGADIINDVSAFRLDQRMGEIVATSGAGVVLMHSRGSVAEMATYEFADYSQDVVADVIREMEGAIVVARTAGVATDSIVVDPGIGFAKRSHHSLRLLAELPRIAALGFPVMVGVSRKRFIGELSGVERPADRVIGTVAANVSALLGGARLFRVHDVAPNREGLDVAWGIAVSAKTAPGGPDPAGDPGPPGSPDSRFPPPAVGGFPPGSG